MARRMVSGVEVVGGLAAVCALASVAFFGLAMGFDPGAGSELVERLVATDPTDAAFVRWGAVMDMLGYYLLPAAVIVAMRKRLTWAGPVSGDMATIAGIMYATIGAIGAGLLATTGPPLIEEGSRDSLLLLETVGNGVEGLWQWLEPLPFTVWAAGVTIALRTSRSRFALLFAVMALGGVLVWIGRLSGLEPVLVAGLILWLGPFPVVMATAGVWGHSRSAG